MSKASQSEIKSGVPIKRRFLLYALTVALPIALFALLEIGLRVAGYGIRDSLLIPTTVNGQPYFRINNGILARYFRKAESLPTPSQDVFPQRKEPGTVRIFAFGESSALGYPYLYNASFSALLKDRLEETFPDTPVEMINFGVTAITSFTVLEFVEEAVQYEPDALLIYTGHNEYYGALGAASSEFAGTNRGFIRLYLGLMRLKMFQLAQNAIGWISELISGAPSPRSGTLMERMVGEKSVPHGSETYRAGLENFRENLRAVAQVAKEHNVPVVFGTLVSNLRHMRPFVSAQTDSLPPASEMYATAQTLDSLKKFDEARRWFTLARDYDALRFRASTDANNVIVQIAREFNAPVAQAESLIAAHSPQGIIGKKFLLEHVHLTTGGYFLLAKAFFDAMKEHGIGYGSAAFQNAKEIPDALLWKRSGITEFDTVAASVRLQILLNSWPFTSKGITIRDIVPRNDMERLAVRFLKQEITWEQAHVMLAQASMRVGDFQRAEREYRALVKATPYNASPYVGLGQALLGMSLRDESAHAFRRAISLEERFEARFGLGVIAFEKGRYDDAVEEFTRAVQLSRGESQDDRSLALFNLALSLANAGRTLEAQLRLRELLTVDPGFEPAKQLQARLGLNR